MIKILMPVLILWMQFFTVVPFQNDVVENLSANFKAGNSKEIAKNFSSSIELSIINEEDTYSKAQAEQILRDFFTKHTPTNSTVVHLIDTNPNYRFCILSLVSKSGKFRVSITLKKSNNALFVTELRIEPDKS